METVVKPPDVERGAFHAYFVYDVADTIDLTKLQTIGGEGLQRAQLELRSVASPGDIQFVSPPLAARLQKVEVEGHQAEVRVKLYGYGPVAVRLSFPFTGGWDGFVELTRSLRRSEAPAKASEQILQQVLEQIKPALNRSHQPILEDYFVAEVEAFESPITAEQLLKRHRTELAYMILGESQAVSAAEQDEALRVQFSYFESDLVIIQWDSAFVYDDRDAAEAVESILEFANTQLVELRKYDARLDDELDAIYGWQSKRNRMAGPFARREADQRAEQIRFLLVDVRELSDRSNNAIKMIGDAFYARLYRGVAASFSLADWQREIEGKLTSVAEVYQFATDQSQHARTEFIEIVIVLLIMVEVVIAVVELFKWGVPGH